jgi:carboxyl-terminal processing protease
VGEIRHEKEKAVEDKKEEGKDSAKVKREEFKTLTLGRTVYGGGGITPDVDVVPERYTPIEIALTRNTFLFRYVIAEHAKMKEKSIKINEKTFEVTDKIFKNFRTFLKKEDFEYSSPEQNILKELKESIDKSRKDPNDTLKVISGPLDKRIDQKFSDLEKVIDKEKDYAFTRHKAIINDRLKGTFLSVGVSQDAYYRFALKNDKYVQEAIKLLKNKQKYSSILKKGFKKDNI